MIYNLKVDLRDKKIKAKKLRRMGIIPASIYGSNLKESILIQIPSAEVNRFLKTVSKGSILTIEVGNNKYNVLLKEISCGVTSNQVEHLEFQHIVADEAVNSVAKVILMNRDSNKNLIQQFVEEIPYKSLPKYFVQEVTIDLNGMKVGSSVKVGDLDIAKNENIKLLMQEETTVITVDDPEKLNLGTDIQAEEDTQDEE